MLENLLTVKNISVEYRSDLETVKAVNHISFTLNRGETLGLVGETGAGKTTTALTLMRLLPEYTGRVPNGEILFEGKNLLALSEADMRMIRGSKIAMIFQDPMTSVNPVISVGDQIAEALELHNEAGRNKAEIDQRGEEVLQMVGIPPQRKYDFPHQFSGGMKQRVVIAIALVCEPDLLIADEPTTALDVTIQAQVINMIRELRDRLGTAMIMITHDLGIVAQTCDNVAVMYAGELIELGTARDIYKSADHHPYTVGLFGSIPNLKTKTDRLTPIPGLMPDMSNPPAGCGFSPRCPHKRDECMVKHPSKYRNGTHAVICHLFAGREGWLEDTEQ
jgi:peptide/nickel transport system ATP-binding protein